VPGLSSLISPFATLLSAGKVPQPANQSRRKAEQHGQASDCCPSQK